MPALLSVQATKYHSPNYPAGSLGKIPIIFGGHFQCVVKISGTLLFQENLVQAPTSERGEGRERGHPPHSRFALSSKKALDYSVCCVKFIVLFS